MFYRRIAYIIVVLVIGIGCDNKSPVEIKKTGEQTIPDSVETTNIKFAGVRSSSYGINPFPSASGWKTAIKGMADYFDGSTPCVLWIVGEIWGNDCHLFFPSNGENYPKVSFDSQDKHESFLNAFDNTGIKVYLQVESGDASITSLIDIVLTRYKKHPCVVGFGVDVEWYRVSERPDWGVKVLDDSAKVWEKQVKSHNPNYKLFLKHWDRNWMPPTYRGDIVFVDDSQGFANLKGMVDEFSDYWADYFNPNLVFFQIGYQRDKSWWKYLSTPPKNIGDAIAATIDQDCGFFWVDFTLRDVFEITSRE